MSNSEYVNNREPCQGLHQASLWGLTPVLIGFGCSALLCAMLPLYQVAFLTAIYHSTTSSPSSARSSGKFNTFTLLCCDLWPFILDLLLYLFLTSETLLKSPTGCPKGLPFLIQTRSLVFLYLSRPYIPGEKLVFGSTRLHGKIEPKCCFSVPLPSSSLIYRRLETARNNCTIKKCSEIIYTDNSETFCEVHDSFVILKVFCRKQILTLCSALVLRVSVMGLMVCWDGL